MALTLDITSDYLIFDNKEMITFQNQGESAITIPNVIRRPAVIGVDGGGGSIADGGRGRQIPLALVCTAP